MSVSPAARLVASVPFAVASITDGNAHAVPAYPGLVLGAMAWSGARCAPAHFRLKCIACPPSEIVIVPSLNVATFSGSSDFLPSSMRVFIASLSPASV